MAIEEFPPIELAGPSGLLAIGGDLEVESLLLAYREGIFPWPIEEEYLTWFAPPTRAVLFLNDFHISRSLKKELRRTELTFCFDKNTDQVIKACAEIINRGSQDGTWITPDIQNAYIKFHQAGYCHSCETYLDGELVGGVYGVSIGGMFAGESMFYRQPNASKLALCYLVDSLKKNDVPWIDCQIMTPFLEGFGAVEIERSDFMKLLKEELKKDKSLFKEKS